MNLKNKYLKGTVLQSDSTNKVSSPFVDEVFFDSQISDLEKPHSSYQVLEQESTPPLFNEDLGGENSELSNDAESYLSEENDSANFNAEYEHSGLADSLSSDEITMTEETLSRAAPTIGFEFDLKYGVNKGVFNTLKSTNLPSGVIFPKEGEELTTHDKRKRKKRTLNDGFSTVLDGPRMEINTAEININNNAEFNKVVTNVMQFASELQQAANKRPDRSISIPGIAGHPIWFEHPKSLIPRFPFVIHAVGKKGHLTFPSKTKLWASPQATITLPLSKVGYLIYAIKKSEGRAPGISFTGHRNQRLGLRSDLAWIARVRMLKSKRIKIGQLLSDNTRVTKGDYSPAIASLVTLLTMYLLTSEKTDRRDKVEGVAKGSLPLNVKTPFWEIFKFALTNREKFVFNELYGNPSVRQEIYKLAKPKATLHDGNNRLFPTRTHRDIDRFHVMPLTWNMLIEHTVSGKPLLITKSNSVSKKKHKLGDQILFAPLSTLREYSKTSPLITIELRRLGFKPVYLFRWKWLMVRLLRLVRRLNRIKSERELEFREDFDQEQAFYSEKDFSSTPDNETIELESDHADKKVNYLGNESDLDETNENFLNEEDLELEEQFGFASEEELDEDDELDMDEESENFLSADFESDAIEDWEFSESNNNPEDEAYESELNSQDGEYEVVGEVFQSPEPQQEMESIGNVFDPDDEFEYDREETEPDGLVESETGARITKYNRMLKIALRNLEPADFKAPWNSSGGKYDTKYWRVVDDPQRKPWKMLKIKSDDKAFDAIRSFLRREDQWTFECASFVQAVHLYALARSRGKQRFLRYFSTTKLTLRFHNSPGLITIKKYRKNYCNEPWIVTTPAGKTKECICEADLLKQTPFGARVMWHNVKGEKAWKNENTVKVGDNRYRGFPLFSARPVKGWKIKMGLAAYQVYKSNDAMLYSILDDIKKASGTDIVNNSTLQSLWQYTRRNVYLREVQTIRPDPAM